MKNKLFAYRTIKHEWTLDKLELIEHRGEREHTHPDLNESAQNRLNPIRGVLLAAASQKAKEKRAEQNPVE